MLKRAFDYSLALFGLFIFSPFWLIFSLAIWLEDIGPVYYVQDRVGKNTRIFKQPGLLSNFSNYPNSNNCQFNES